MMKLIDQWRAYLGFCLDAPIAAPACRPFWIWIMVAALAIGMLAVLYPIYKIIDYKLKLRAALKAQAMRDTVADEATMANHRWTGDDVNVQHTQNAEARIRAAIARRKGTNHDPTV